MPYRRLPGGESGVEQVPGENRTASRTDLTTLILPGAARTRRRSIKTGSRTVVGAVQELVVEGLSAGDHRVHAQLALHARPTGPAVRRRQVRVAEQSDDGLGEGRRIARRHQQP